MEVLKTTRKVVVPRCDTCDGRFQLGSRVFCEDCKCDIHYDCAVYADDDRSDMLCLDCYKSTMMEKALVRDQILKKSFSEGIKVYIGKAFWDNLDNDVKKKIKVEEGCCEHELECEIIDDDDKCKFCGWCSEFPESHIVYGNFKCKYITSLYKLKLDDEGDLVWEEYCKDCLE